MPVRQQFLGQPRRMGLPIVMIIRQHYLPVHIKFPSAAG